MSDDVTIWLLLSSDSVHMQPFTAYLSEPASFIKKDSERRCRAVLAEYKMCAESHTRVVRAWVHSLLQRVSDAEKALSFLALSNREWSRGTAHIVLDALPRKNQFALHTTDRETLVTYWLEQNAIV